MLKKYDCRECRFYLYILGRVSFRKYGCAIDVNYEFVWRYDYENGVRSAREIAYICQMATHDMSTYPPSVQVLGYWEGWESKCKYFELKPKKNNLWKDWQMRKSTRIKIREIEKKIYLRKVKNK